MKIPWSIPDRFMRECLATLARELGKDPDEFTRQVLEKASKKIHQKRGGEEVNDEAH